MPYHVAKTSKCPTSKPWGVIKDSDGKVMGCHPSKEKANKQLAALYANEPKDSSMPVDEKASGRKDVRAARAEYTKRGEVPGGKLRERSFSANMTARLEQRDGKQMYHVDGFATVYERAYHMWDMFGEYNEVMDRGALDKSLSGNPDVAFLVNHKGVTMARTTNGTLVLSNTPDPETGYTGLHVDAWLNPDRGDVHDFVTALTDKNIDEMSFAFMLNEGEWNEDYSEFRITEADIHRGDVSGVNYGANPFTSIQARTADILADIERLPAVALPRAQEILSGRVMRMAGSLSQRSAAYYERATKNFERLAAESSLQDFDLTDMDFSEFEIADETREPDESPSAEDVKREFDEIETPENNEPPLEHREGGKPVHLWQLMLDNLKENKE